jgi:ABC-type uncharacterized transport system permease subunit
MVCIRIWESNQRRQNNKQTVDINRDTSKKQFSIKRPFASIRPEYKRLLSRTFEALLPLIAVPLALLVGAGMLLALGVNPLEAYGAMVQGAFGNVSGFTQTLVKATPLLLVGLGVTIAFRGGVINIGGEGQILVGGLAATALAVGFPTVSGWILLPACMLGATLAGAVWGGIPGVLKARMGVNEILSTVMMNAIALQLANYLLRGPMIDPEEIERGTRIAQSALLPAQVWLPRLIPRTLLAFWRHPGGDISYSGLHLLMADDDRLPYPGCRFECPGFSLCRHSGAGLSSPGACFGWGFRRVSRRN